jgi:hypothetical protein
MKASRKLLSILYLTGLMLCSIVALGQTHLPPVAQNDSVSVIQPYADTVNVTANDSSPSGDSFCVTKVYGSAFFTLLNCNQVAFRSDSGSFGNDTAWYVICNDSQPNLCDTGTVIATVVRHYTPLMLNNARWITYIQSDCDNAGFEEWTYYWTTTDTLINSKVYRVVYTNSVSVGYYCPGTGGPGLPITSQTQHAGFLRQDTVGHKVYVLMPDSTNEHLLYDFDLQVGDTINKLPNVDTMVVNSIDYYSNTENYFRRINISSFRLDGGVGTWIEGIGSMFGPVSAFGDMFSSYLLCFSTNGQTLYPNYSNDTCAYITVGIENVISLPTSIHPNRCF